MAVAAIDGLTLSGNQQFIIANVVGTASGQFINYAEGSLVGNFGGVELFISYVGGDGNDVVLQTAPVILGDVNQDGVVNLLDVDPFIEVLSTAIYQAEADANQDGVVNLLDVEPFIAILSGG